MKLTFTLACSILLLASTARAGGNGPAPAAACSASGNPEARGGAAAGPRGRGAHELEPGVHGFATLTDRLAPITFTIHLVAPSHEDKILLGSIRGLIHGAVEQINAQIGPGRLQVEEVFNENPAAIQGRPGHILVQVGEPGKAVGVDRAGETKLHGIGGFIFPEEVFGATITLKRELLDALDHRRGGIPFVVLHELLHALGLDHFEKPFGAPQRDQVMRECCHMFGRPDEARVDQYIEQNIERTRREYGGLTAGQEARLREGIRRGIPAGLECRMRERNPGTLGEGDINGLKYLTRQDPCAADGTTFSPMALGDYERENVESRRRCGEGCTIL